MGLTVLVGLGACAAAARGADAWTNYDDQNGLPGNDVQFVKPDPAGGVWIGTLRGPVRWQDGRFSRIDDERGKPIGSSAWDVLAVAKDDYWLGTNDGAWRLHAGQIKQYLPRLAVAQIVPFGPDALLAKVAKGVMVFRGGEWKTVESMRDCRAEILTAGPGNTVWVTSEADGVYELEPNKLDAPKHHLSRRSVKVVLPDKDGRVWVGTWAHGVEVYDGKEWVRHLKDEKSYILAMVQDAKGQIWAATSEKGVYRYDGKEWHNYLKDEGAINMLAATSDGRVWVSSQNVPGLRYFAGEKWVLSLETDLPIRCLCESSDGWLWAGGVIDGVHVLKKK